MKVRDVVVGVDGSVESCKAVVWAAREAVRRDVTLRVVHAWHAHAYPTDPFFIAPIADLVNEPVTSARDYVSQAMDLARTTGPTLDIKVATPAGPAAWTLIEQAADAQLLVIGGTHRGAIDRAVFGSVTTHAVTHARCPVVVVRAPYLELGDPTLGKGPVVVGVDRSVTSEIAADFAFDYAAGHGLEVVAVEAWLKTDLPRVADDAVVAVERASAGILDSLSAVRDRYPDVKVTPLPVLGHPVRALIEQGELATLLVVGSRGLGRFEGMLLGSVSAALVHQATVTVAVVRPLDTEHESASR